MKYIAVILLLLAAALPARAESPMDVHDAWIRHIPGDRPMAGYFVMNNTSDMDRRLVSVTSSAFGSVGIHETVERDGATSMQPVDSIAVPAGESFALEPGGYHLMLMQRRKGVEVGDEVSMMLEFADGTSQSVVFAVKPAWQE